MSARWTKVTTRLPRPRNWKNGRYLVTNGLNIWVETQHPSWWNTIDKRGPEYNGARVTHWMSVPELPK